MQENLKRILNKSFQQCIDEIEASSDKCTTKDIAFFFNEIFSANIITIVCGDVDVEREKIELEFEDASGSGKYYKKQMSLTETINLLFSQVLSQMGNRYLNPINTFWRLTGKLYPFSR